MNAFEKHLAEDRRLVILRLLHQDTDYTLNDRMLQVMLRQVGHNVSLTALRADLEWLRQAQAISVKCDVADVYVATLERLGLDHVERTAIIPGIKRPGPAGSA
jgi:hypothetical protein